MLSQLRRPTFKNLGYPLIRALQFLRWLVPPMSHRELASGLAPRSRIPSKALSLEGACSK